MLKKSAFKRIITSSLALIITLLIYFFPNSENIAMSEEIIYESEITMPVYAIDHNNYVARANVITNDNQIEYIIDLLTIDSKFSVNLPIGFRGIIPKGTKLLSYSLDNYLLKLDFSKEFLNIDKDEEEKLIESLIYSLCELDEVKQIMIFINGEQLQKLPNSGKNLPIVLTKEYGINKLYTFDNYKNTIKTTIYYLSKYNDSIYYIPITKITNDNIEPVEIIVSEMQKTPIYETNLISYLNAAYELKDYEVLENSISLAFDNKLIANLEDNDINEQVKYTISLSLRDTYDIEDIVININ